MKWKYKNLFVILILLIALPMSFAQEQNNTSNETIIDDEVVDDEENVEEEVEEENVEEEVEEESDDEVVDDEEVEEESEEVEEESEEVVEEEIESFKTNHGAYVRLLQLQRSIHMNILKGDLLLNRLGDEIDEDSLEELELILLTMEELKDNISEYELQGNPADVEVFVSFKKDAIALSKEFRDNIRVFVQDSEQNALRAQINREVRATGELEQYKTSLRERSRLHNGEVVRASISDLDEQSEELINRIRNEDIDVKEIKKEVLNLIKEVKGNQSREMIKEMREEVMRQRISVKEEQANIRGRMNENHTLRMREKMDRLKENLSEDIDQRIQDRLNNMSERIQNNRD